MHPHLFPSSFLFFFFIFANLPISLCEDDYRYSNCNLASECGGIKNITYPFWGNGRPDYCGRPGFHLYCRNNSFFEIEILSQRYRVVSVNPENQVLRIARLDFWNDICPFPVDNATLDFNLFDYSPTGMNLTWFYGCPSGSHRFSCRIKYTSGNAHFEYENVTSVPIPISQNLSTCNSSFVVPVLQTGVERLTTGRSTLGAVLREGFDVNYFVDVPFCKRCEDSGGRCGYNQTLLQRPICFCPDQPQQSNCLNWTASRRQPKGLGNSGTMIAIAVPSVLGVVIATSFVLILSGYLRKNCTSYNSMEEQKSGSQHRSSWKKFMPKKIMMVSSTDKELVFFRNNGSLAPKRYKYLEVKKMTNSFKDKLGEVDFGVVFKGKLFDGRLVAVKVLGEAEFCEEAFINEVATISKISHVNIITLIGFCLEGHRRALVYEVMPKGSLEKFIYYENPLSHPYLGWETLYKIAIGIARGLEYLHNGCNTQILHLDISPRNILLDQELCPKICSFELAELCPVRDKIVSMRCVACARGTTRYIAPEVINGDIGGVSNKSDVYSYGMILLEMVGGRKIIDLEVKNISERYFPSWICDRLDQGEDLGLHGVTTEEDDIIIQKMIFVSLWCIQMNPSDRPSMKKVWDMLEGSLEALQMPPLPVLSSP